MDDDDFFLVSPKSSAKKAESPKDYDLLSAEEKKAIGPVADLSSLESMRKKDARRDSAIDRLNKKYGLIIKNRNAEN